jgi:hypothetical protein
MQRGILEAANWLVLRTRDLVLPSADASQKRLGPSIDGFENDPVADLPNDDLALVVGEATILRQADGLTAAILEYLCTCRHARKYIR